MKKLLLLMLVAGMAITSQAQTEDQKLARQIYKTVLENAMKEYESLFYTDVWFTRNTMVIEISSSLDTKINAKELWKVMEDEWDEETKDNICTTANIIFMKITVDDKYHNNSFKDRIIKPHKIY